MQPMYGQPMYGQPTQPMYGQTMYGQPMGGQMYGMPNPYTQPGYTQPQYPQPGYSQPHSQPISMSTATQPLSAPTTQTSPNTKGITLKEEKKDEGFGNFQTSTTANTNVHLLKLR